MCTYRVTDIRLNPLHSCSFNINFIEHAAHRLVLETDRETQRDRDKTGRDRDKERKRERDTHTRRDVLSRLHAL